MEALKKLEEVQRMVSFVTSSGLASDDPDSDGFLAHFLLFLVQTSGMLDMEKRCHLISEHLSKISPAFLEEARVCMTAEDSQQNPAMCPILQLHPDNKRDIFPLRTNEKDMAMIGLDSMLRANSTLEDFCRSYFMFHGMDVNEPQTLFRFLPVLSFTESYIYQLDSFNEEILCSLMECRSLEKGPDFVDDTYRDEGNERLSNNILDAFKTDPLRPLVVLLEHHGLLTDGCIILLNDYCFGVRCHVIIECSEKYARPKYLFFYFSKFRLRTEVSSGTEYWALERKLCHALISKKEIPIEDVMRAIHLKSFDYRVLNLLLYQLREQPVNDLHMEFLSISEFLVEVSDDLYDYEDDVVENSFNILRMFVRLYGASMAPSMLAKCISEAEEKYERLLKALDPELSLKYTRRCEEATKEGGKVSGHKLGTWNMPPVIADEEAYRSHILKLKSNDSARLD